MGGYDPEITGTVADLRAQLKQKDLELQAIKAKYEHLCRRFRDNLGCLSTLFAAQARRTVQPDLCRNCISCLLGVYELDDVGDELVSMADYLPALSKALVTGFDSRIRLATSVDPTILIELRRANCIGLIYAEAASNSLKHAFPGLVSGSVYASLRSDGARLALMVVDSGLGFDPETATNGGGDGLAFMRDLARQIQGDLRIKTSQTGTTVCLLCPV